MRYIGMHSFPLNQSVMERVMGIEPTFSAWEADVLPFNYTRIHTTSGVCPLGARQILYTAQPLSRTYGILVIQSLVLDLEITYH